jgi:hypothetical protein
MPEVIIKYNKPETLKILKGLGKYLDFSVSASRAEKHNIDDQKKISKTEITIIPGNPAIDTTDMLEIFSGRNLDAQELRKKAWNRKK